LSRKLTWSGPADCNGPTPCSIRSLSGATAPHAAATAAAGCGPVRAKKRGSPATGSASTAYWAGFGAAAPGALAGTADGAALPFCAIADGETPSGGITTLGRILLSCSAT
jgi:hypothetical protein